MRSSFIFARRLQAIGLLTLLVISALPASTASAQTGCAEGQVLVIDKSSFQGTMDKALTLIAKAGVTGVKEQVETEKLAIDDRLPDLLARLDKRPSQKLVVMHFSSFSFLGSDRNPEAIRDVIRDIEGRSAGTKPFYILYSASLFDPVRQPDGRTLDALRHFRQKGDPADAAGMDIFEDVDDSRIELIYTSPGSRLIDTNGGRKLFDTVKRLVDSGLCK